MKREKTDIWFEKRGAGPLPHYRVVRRRRAPAAGVLVVAAGFVVLALFPGVVAVLAALVVLTAIGWGVYEAR
jgi:hypothetical protein